MRSTKKKREKIRGFFDRVGGLFSPSSSPWKTNRDLRPPPSSPPTQSRCYTRRSATISERCLSGLDQIYSYEFQKALDSSPKRSLLADAAPKIRVLAVGLLVDAFVRLPRYPRRRARESGIAMAPIPSRREVLGVSLRRIKNPNNFFLSQEKHVKFEN